MSLTSQHQIFLYFGQQKLHSALPHYATLLNLASTQSHAVSFHNPYLFESAADSSHSRIFPFPPATVKLGHFYHLDVTLDENWILVYRMEWNEDAKRELLVQMSNITQKQRVAPAHNLLRRRILEAIPFQRDDYDFLHRIVLSIMRKYVGIGAQQQGKSKGSRRTLMLHLPSLEHVTTYHFMLALLNNTLLRIPQIKTHVIIERSFNVRHVRREMTWVAVREFMDEELEDAYEENVSWYWLAEEAHKDVETEDVPHVVMSGGKMHRSVPEGARQVVHVDIPTFVPDAQAESMRFFVERLCGTDAANSLPVEQSLTAQESTTEEDTTTDSLQNLPTQPPPPRILFQHSHLYKISLSSLRIVFHSFQFMHKQQKTINSLMQNVFHTLNGAFVALGHDAATLQNQSTTLPLVLDRYPAQFTFRGFALVAHLDMQQRVVYLRTHLNLESGIGDVINTLLLSGTRAPDARILSPEVHGSSNGIPYYTTLLPKESHLSDALDATKFRDIGAYGERKTQRRERYQQGVAHRLGMLRSGR